MDARLFISYSSVDGLDFALNLADALEAGPPSYPVWMDRRNIRAGHEWDEEVAEALRTCGGLLFVASIDSVKSGSMCKQEWSRAMKYKKNVIPLRLNPDVELPFRLDSRQYIDFEDFTTGIAQLRRQLAWLRSQDGILFTLQARLAEAVRELPRTSSGRQAAVEAEIADLQRQIDRQLLIIAGKLTDNDEERDRVGIIGLPRDLGSESTLTPGSGDTDGVVTSGSSYRDESDISDANLKSLCLANCVGMSPGQLGAELVAGSIVVDSSICDYSGIELSDVITEDVGFLENVAAHPSFIVDTKLDSISPEPNRSKAHLIEWDAPVIDQGDILTLRIARSDFWTSEATKRNVPRIQAEVLNRRIDLMELPRRLDLHLVVVSGVDNMLHLARRGRNVATEPSTWMATVGESVDWDGDRDATGAVHPMITARRCLSERDELNLPDAIAESATFRLVAIATEWSEMLVNLIVLVKLPTIEAKDVHRYFRKGENMQIDCIPFDVESCMNFLKSKQFNGSSGASRPMPISDISRVSLLAALRSEYSLGDIVAAV